MLSDEKGTPFVPELNSSNNLHHSPTKTIKFFEMKEKESCQPKLFPQFNQVWEMIKKRRSTTTAGQESTKKDEKEPVWARPTKDIFTNKMTITTVGNKKRRDDETTSMQVPSARTAGTPKTPNDEEKKFSFFLNKLPEIEPQRKGTKEHKKHSKLKVSINDKILINNVEEISHDLGIMQIGSPNQKWNEGHVVQCQKEFGSRDEQSFLQRLTGWDAFQILAFFEGVYQRFVDLIGKKSKEVGIDSECKAVTTRTQQAHVYMKEILQDFIRIYKMIPPLPRYQSTYASELFKKMSKNSDNNEDLMVKAVICREWLKKTLDEMREKECTTFEKKKRKKDSSFL